MRINEVSWDFLSGPVIKNPLCNAGDIGLISGWRTKIAHNMGQPSAHHNYYSTLVLQLRPNAAK